MKRNRMNDTTLRVAAMQIDDSHLQLVVIEEEDAVRTMHYDHVEWRKHSPLYSAESTVALGKALRSLSTKWRLSEAALSLCISGDLCVTRVVAGRTEEVASELQDLEDRCALYLSLGPGRKVVAKSVRKVDVRRDHGLAAVVNERLLILLADAIHDSSIKVSRIQPSAIGLSHYVGQENLDHDQPALILNATHNAHELCLSYKGHLYLNYRPAGKGCHDEIATLVNHHLVRLRRYCRRMGLSDEADLDTVYVAGRADDTTAIAQAFDGGTAISAKPISKSSQHVSWSTDDESRIPEHAALIGTCLHHLGGTTEEQLDLLPDVKGRMKRSWREKLQPWLCTAVAALAVCAISKCIVWQQQKFVSDLEEKTRPFMISQAAFEQKFQKLNRLQAEIKELKSIEVGLTQPHVESMLNQITHCMPPRMRLKTLNVEQKTVSLKGIADHEEAVYEFLRWLKQLPCLTRCALVGTTPVHHRDNAKTEFEIECILHSIRPLDAFESESSDGVI